MMTRGKEGVRGSDVCPHCGSMNTYENDGWWYCNECMEIWKEV